MTKNPGLLAYAALVLAMMISAGNFIFGNLAVEEISPPVLTFWRCLIATTCVLPFVLRAQGNPFRFFLDDWERLTVLSIVGVVMAPVLVYIALRSDDLIDLAAGYTSIPLFTVLFSAVLLGERLRPIQYLGLAAALTGALVIAFKGSWQNAIHFDPHVAFLFMLACTSMRALYLVLARRWSLHPRPERGLFVMLALATVILFPFFVLSEAQSASPMNYSWRAWGSILFIGVGMGAIYLHLLNFGAHTIGASNASLFTYLVPLFVTVESLLFRSAQLHAYQGVGAGLIIAGVLIVTRTHAPGPATAPKG